ncbi:MAG: DUF4190 domain-containing protein [Limisphaerales bacterium]
MSEFNFSCPVCGQNILCDTVLQGTQHICPHCNNTVGVPTGFAEPAGVPPQTDAPPAWTGHDATTAAPRTSRLAIASLICSLASLVTCIGWIPGIICGHLAKSRIRRDSSLKGNGLATAGLTIGYLILALEAGTVGYRIWSFSNAVKQGIVNIRQNLATNNLIVTRTPSTTASNASQPMEPIKPVAAASSGQQMAPAASGWTSDTKNVSFPDHPASGKLRGIDFELKTATLRGANFRINSENGFSLEILGLDEPIEGQSYAVQPVDNGGVNPHVRMTWHEGDVVMTATYSKGYGMKLQFGQVVNRKVSGKIYLCLPDGSKSYVAGTFEVRILKSK